MLPVAMRSATIAVDCRPDEQKRLMVIAGTESGTPARKPTWRATLRPCSASGCAHPSTMSSMTAGSTSARRSASRETCAARSSGRVFLKTPRGARPMAVRTAERIATSRMVGPSVPKRLALLQHVLDAVARLRFPAQREEPLPLEVEDVLLADGRAGGYGTARQRAGEMAGDDGVVGGDLVRAQQVDERLLERGLAAFAHDADAAGRGGGGRRRRGR